MGHRRRRIVLAALLGVACISIESSVRSSAPLLLFSASKAAESPLAKPATEKPPAKAAGKSRQPPSKRTGRRDAKAVTKPDPHAELRKQKVGKFQELVKEHPTLEWQWRQYCSRKGLVEYNPKDAELSVLQSFLSDVEDGGLVPMKAASKELASAVFELHRKDRTAMWRWGEYCNDAALGIRNPGRLTSAVVQKFLDDYEELPPIDMATDETVERVKDLNVMWRNDWRDFLSKNCYGINDVEKLTEEGAHSVLREASKRRIVEGQQRGQEKRALVIALQRLLRRQEQPNITYTVSEDKPYNATVMLPADIAEVWNSSWGPLPPLAHGGLSAASKQLAENSAATVALEVFANTAVTWSVWALVLLGRFAPVNEPV
eukprot:TRINITY_DN51732_c0_g1_i2.p1 TRINITY_DN51732_c0_g1~~TRINITY_DN51732_c0_g1_i2.p1  ORF type:complete len:374 (+),score=84.29 TRINITY_DN51732_c0_g1_i2:133-1254(+)